jgi:CRISPR-associated protein Csd1
MFVQALAAYADEKLKDELNDVAFEERAVPYYLSLAADGRFLAVIPRFVSVPPANGKGKPKQRAQTHRVPRSPVNRNAGQHPMLAADEIGYVLGPGPWTKPNDVDKVTKLHEAFVALIHRVATETQDEGLLACSRFYANPDELQRAHTRLAELEAPPGSNIALYFSGGPVTDRETVQLWWRSHYEAATEKRASTDTAECLISGVVGPIPPTHPKIKHTAALGGQPSGVSLMSFDKGAFRSYGWEQNANSPVSADRAMAYVLALNSLLKPGSPNRRDFGDVAFLFWLRKDSPLNPAEMLDETPTPAYIEEVQRVIELNRNVWIDDDAQFYMAAVSANGSRLILRSWITELLPVAAENVLAWWEGLQMQPFSPNDPLNTPRFWQLLYAIEREGKPSAGRIVDLRRRALLGSRAPLGYRIIADVLQRMKVDAGKRTDLAALGLLRLCLNDLNQSTGEKQMPPSIDTENPNLDRAYLCGRLLALHDDLQRTTFWMAENATVNTTVADRFYTLVMNSPSVGMTGVFDLGRKHLTKLRKLPKGHSLPNKSILKEGGYPIARAIELSIGEIEVPLTEQGGIPHRFGMHDKARFALGFYHQKAYRPKKAGSSDDSTETDTTLISDDINDDTTPEKESAQ